jgi:hypothetical protein
VGIDILATGRYTGIDGLAMSQIKMNWSRIMHNSYEQLSAQTEADLRAHLRRVAIWPWKAIWETARGEAKYPFVVVQGADRNSGASADRAVVADNKTHSPARPDTTAMRRRRETAIDTSLAVAHPDDIAISMWPNTRMPKRFTLEQWDKYYSWHNVNITMPGRDMDVALMGQLFGAWKWVEISINGVKHLVRAIDPEFVADADE